MTDPAELLARLVAFPTQNPDGDEGALAAMLADELGARGPDAVETGRVARPSGRDSAWVLARWGAPRVLVNAHIDTVPANAGWSGDPFLLRREKKRLIGLGAADTKGAIAAILCALDEARPRDVMVLFSGDEEHGGHAMRALVAGGLRERFATETPRAIVCEPTSLRAGVRHRGILCLESRLTGHGGHSSRADQLPAPLADCARLAVALDDWGRQQRERGPEGFRGMCLNVARLDGGIAFNVVPDEARLVVSLRPPPGSEISAVEEELRGIAARALPSAKIDFTVENRPFATRDLAGFRPWLGARVEAPVDLAFWTEAAVLSAAGIDAVVIGPGDIAHAHAPDEHVTVEELHAARDLFAEMFRGTR